MLKKRKNHKILKKTTLTALTAGAVLSATLSPSVIVFADAAQSFAVTQSQTPIDTSNHEGHDHGIDDECEDDQTLDVQNIVHSHKEPVNFSIMASTIGDGFSWDATTRTLTLENFHIEVATTEALRLPANTTVIISGENTIMNNGGHGILMEGNVIFSEASTGTLVINTQANGRNIQGLNGRNHRLTINGGTFDFVAREKAIELNTFVQNGGTITMYSSNADGIYAQNFEINDGDLKIHTDGARHAIGLYGSYVQTGGNVDLYAKGHHALWAGGSMRLADGNLNVKNAHASQGAIRVNNASAHAIAIEGGSLNVIAPTLAIFLPSGGLEVSGGNVTIDAKTAFTTNTTAVMDTPTIFQSSGATNFTDIHQGLVISPNQGVLKGAVSISESTVILPGQTIMAENGSELFVATDGILTVSAGAVLDIREADLINAGMIQNYGTILGRIIDHGGEIITERLIRNPKNSKQWMIEGNQVVIEAGFVLASGETLFIDTDQTLLVPTGSEMFLESGATLENNGTIENAGLIASIDAQTNGQISGQAVMKWTQMYDVYTLANFSHISNAGMSRGQNHDKQYPGLILATDEMLQVRQINPNFTNTTGLSVFNNDQQTEVGVNIPANGTWTQVTTLADSVPFVRSNMASTSETPRYDFITSFAGTSDVPVYTYQGDEVAFLHAWDESQAAFAIIDSPWVTILAPWKDRQDARSLNAQNGNSSGANAGQKYATYDELLATYGKIISFYNEFAGLEDDAENPLHQNVVAKYFAKANINGYGAAYYGGDHMGINGDSVWAYLNPYWLTLHEVGHGYEGNFRGRDMQLSETWNNIYAHYFQMQDPNQYGGDWLGKLNPSEVSRIEGLREQGYQGLESVKSNLYVLVNLLDTIGPREAMAHFHREWRELVAAGTTENTTTNDFMIRTWSDASGMNVAPYFEAWGFDIEPTTQTYLAEKGYQNIYPLHYLSANNAEAETLRAQLGLERVYSLTQTQSLAKTEKQRVEIAIEIDDFTQIQGQELIITDGTNVIETTVIDTPKLTVELPLGMYTLQWPTTASKGTYAESTYDYLAVANNEKNTFTKTYGQFGNSPLLNNFELKFTGLSNNVFLQVTYDETAEELILQTYNREPHAYFSDMYAQIEVYAPNGESLYEREFIGNLNTGHEIIRIPFEQGSTIRVHHREGESRLGVFAPMLNNEKIVSFERNQDMYLHIAGGFLQHVDATQAGDVLLDQYFRRYLDNLLNQHGTDTVKKLIEQQPYRGMISATLKELTQTQREAIFTDYTELFSTTPSFDIATDTVVIKEHENVSEALQVAISHVSTGLTNHVDIDTSIIPVNPETGFAVPGTYDVTFTLTNHFYASVSKTATIEIVAREFNDITFELGNGATMPSLAMIEAAQVAVDMLPIPEYANHTFLGWFVDADFTQAVDTFTMPNANVTLYAKWLDNHNPVFEGINDTTIKIGDEFDALEGIQALDFNGQPLDIQVSGRVNTGKLGTYELTYTVIDSDGRTISAVRTITVRSNDVPTLSQMPDIVHYFGREFDLLAGIEAFDTEDGELVVIVSGEFNPHVAGVYIVTYTASDSDGNVVSFERTITIIDDHSGFIHEDNLDFTNRPSEDGYGYQWNAQTKTLVINNLQVDVSMAAAVIVPANTTIIVRGENRIVNATGHGILMHGNVVVSEASTGRLAINTQANGRNIQGLNGRNHSLTINGGTFEFVAREKVIELHTFVQNAGSVNLYSNNSDGIYTQNAEIHGGELKIHTEGNRHAIGAYGSYVQTGGNVDLYAKGHHALWAGGSMRLSDGNLNVKNAHASQGAIRVNNGSARAIAIEGGNLNVSAPTLAIFLPNGGLDVSGGNVTLDAKTGFTTNTTAVIDTPTIFQSSGVTNFTEIKQGLVISPNQGTVVGDVTINETVKIPVDYTIVAQPDSQLTISDSGTLIIAENAVLDVQNSKLVNNGVLLNHGTILGTVVENAAIEPGFGESGDVMPGVDFVNSAPVIIGADDVTIVAGELFDLLAGVYASDEEDNDFIVSATLTVTGDIDFNVAGTYTITYTVSDTAGLTTSVTRTITIIENSAIEPGFGESGDVMPGVDFVNSAPVIIGADDVTIVAGELFDLLAGVYASDEEDNDFIVSATLTVTGDIDFNVAGTYTITYTVSDTAGLTTTVERTITIIENSAIEPGFGESGDAMPGVDFVNNAPVIIGADDVTIVAGTLFDLLAGISANDEEDGELHITSTGDIDFNVAGTYTITYTVSDTAGLTTTVERTITIIENSAINPDFGLDGDTMPGVDFVNNAPVIIGADNVTIVAGTVFDLFADVWASDEEDGEVLVTIDDTIDFNIAGTYTITYTAMDSAGLTTSAIRTITIIENAAIEPGFGLDGDVMPDIDTTPLLAGIDDITIEIGTAFDMMAGVVVKDGHTMVGIYERLNVHVVGDYELIYHVVDPLGEMTIFVRTIRIEDTGVNQVVPQTTHLDFTNMPTTIGSGFQWNADTRTLTLNNFVSDVSAAVAVTLPSNTVIILHGENSITNTMGHGILMKGNLIVSNRSTGTLTMTSLADGRNIQGEGNKYKLTVHGGTLDLNARHKNIQVNEFVQNGGAITMQSTADNALDTPYATINDGELTILSGGRLAIATWVYAQHGGTVNLAAHAHHALWVRDGIQITAGDLNATTTHASNAAIHINGQNSGEFVMTGGSVVVTAANIGINSPNSTLKILGGDVKIEARTAFNAPTAVIETTGSVSANGTVIPPSPTLN